MRVINDSTLLINVATGEYPVYLSKVRQDHPNVSMAIEPREELIRKLGYEIVIEVAKPEGDVVIECPPLLTAGVYFQVYSVRDFTEEELTQQLAGKKNDLSVRINTLRDAELEVGYRYTADNGDSFTVQTRMEDRLNLLYLNISAQQMIAAGYDDPQVFRTGENTTQLLSPDELFRMTDEVLGHYRKVLDASWRLKDRISAAQTTEQLPAVPESLVE